MKRSTRVYLILATVLLVLGLVLGAVGCVLGAVDDIRAGANDDAQQTSFFRSPDSIQGIQLELSSNDIIILPSKDSDLHISYPSDGNYAYDTETDTVTGQNTLVFYQLPQNGAFLSHFSFSFTKNTGAITLELPEGYSGDITCSVTSGKISAEGISLGKVQLSTSSGDVELTDCRISGALTCETTSGDVELENLQLHGATVLETVSGELALEDCTVSDSLSLSSTSGEIDLGSTAVLGDLTADSISGDISLLLSGSPKHRFADISTVSGDISTFGGDPNGDRSISASTTSGDIYIEDKKKRPETTFFGLRTVSIILIIR
jgi:DUF4097 and DUF4098 domain-containing protein YvlB